MLSTHSTHSINSHTHSLSHSVNRLARVASVTLLRANAGECWSYSNHSLDLLTRSLPQSVDAHDSLDSLTPSPWPGGMREAIEFAGPTAHRRVRPSAGVCLESSQTAQSGRPRALGGGSRWTVAGVLPGQSPAESWRPAICEGS